MASDQASDHTTYIVFGPNCSDEEYNFLVKLEEEEISNLTKMTNDAIEHALKLLNGENNG